MVREDAHRQTTSSVTETGTVVIKDAHRETESSGTEVLHSLEADAIGHHSHHNYFSIVDFAYLLDFKQSLTTMRDITL